MRHRIAGPIVLSFVLVLSLSSCTKPQEETASFSDQDAGAVRTNLETAMGADPIDAPETFFTQFTEDVYWVFHKDAPWAGTEELRSVDWCHTLLGEITADRIEGSGDLAYARGTYRLSLDCGEEEPVKSEGVFISTHRRQEDGSWRIESLLQRD